MVQGNRAGDANDKAATEVAAAAHAAGWKLRSFSQPGLLSHLHSRRPRRLKAGRGMLQAARVAWPLGGLASLPVALQTPGSAQRWCCRCNTEAPY